MSYNTVADYKRNREKSRNEGSDSDVDIQRALDSAQELIHSSLQRHFQTTPEGDYEYVYNGEPFLIPDFSTISSVEPQGSERRLRGKPGHFPYNRIRFVNRPMRGDTVRVKGKRGWAAVPSAILEAELDLAAIIRVEGPRSKGQVTTLTPDGGTSITSTSRDSRQILADLMREYKWEPFYEAEEA